VNQVIVESGHEVAKKSLENHYERAVTPLWLKRMCIAPRISIYYGMRFVGTMINYGDTLTKLGYSYNELHHTVSANQGRKGLYSWGLAMRTKDDGTIKDRFISHRY